jgi:hypothetical protein
MVEIQIRHPEAAGHHQTAMQAVAEWHQVEEAHHQVEEAHHQVEDQEGQEDQEDHQVDNRRDDHPMTMIKI